MTMTMTWSDLIPLLPILLSTGTVVIAMLMIGIRRHYALTAAITIIGLITAAIAALVLMPDTNSQITPLLIIDKFSLFFSFVVCIAGLFIAILSFPYLYTLGDHREEFFLLIGLATIGGLVMVSSNHFVSLLLGLETMSMALYGMIAYPLHCRDVSKYPLEAAVKYLVLSASASAIMLFGMALLYGHTGTLAFSSLSENSAGLAVASGSWLSTVGVLFLLSGIAFKLSLAPFHLWTPDVYEGAPLPATAYLATVGKAAMFVALVRFIEITDALSIASVLSVVGLLAMASMLIGNLLALLQNNLKRILAYSSIAHMGYLLIALIASYFVEGSLSIEAVSFYLLAYVIMTLGAFGVASVVSSSQKEFDVIHDYRGLFWRQPWLAAIFTAMLLSLAGIPLTVGFIGKFYVFFAGVESGLWVLLGTLVLGSGIGLYYYLRIVYRMLMPIKEQVAYKEAGIESLTSYGVLAILFLLLVVLGVYPAPVMTLLESAASLMG